MTDTPHYADDRVALWHGDALAVLRSMPSASVDALVADPPYSSGGMTRGDRVGSSTIAKYVSTGSRPESVDFAGDNRDQRAYAYWCALWLAECLRIVRPAGLALQSGGWVWRGIVPWVKPLHAARPQAGRFMAQCEYVVWGSRGALPIRMGVDPALPGFFHGGAPRDREHITQKPVDVLQEMLELVPADGVVLDPFMGSGTTGVAAVATGRRFVGVEQEAHYVAVAERRIRSAIGHAVPDGQQAAFDLTADA